MKLEDPNMTPSTMTDSSGRNNQETLALILAGGRGQALNVLTGGMAKPAIPFAGKYRVIDFVLSNLAQSELKRIAMLTQFNPELLIEHVKTYEFDETGQHRLPEIQTWQPSMERTGHAQYLGTADAVHQNRKFILEENCDQVLILAGDHIYHQDYRDLLRFHQEKGADLTIAVMEVRPEESSRFGMLEMDQNQRITRFVEKPKQSVSSLASMGIYVFNTAFLLDCLEKDAQNKASGHDFGANIIPSLIQSCKVYAYRFSGYWADIDTIETYWKASLALLDSAPSLNLRDSTWMLPVCSTNTLPADIRPTGAVTDSLISEGCVIEGEVLRSILSPGVKIEKGARVVDSIIFHDTTIHTQAVVKDCLVGTGVEIGANALVGGSGELTHNSTEQGLTTGITAIGKQARIPAGTTIERNCFIEGFVETKDFKILHVPSGTSIRK
jgi:glucose-1-phosphate adenylyltransferase